MSDNRSVTSQGSQLLSSPGTKPKFKSQSVNSLFKTISAKPANSSTSSSSSTSTILSSRKSILTAHSTSSTPSPKLSSTTPIKSHGGSFPQQYNGNSLGSNSGNPNSNSMMTSKNASKLNLEKGIKTLSLSRKSPIGSQNNSSTNIISGITPSPATTVQNVWTKKISKEVPIKEADNADASQPSQASNDLVTPPTSAATVNSIASTSTPTSTSAPVTATTVANNTSVTNRFNDTFNSSKFFDLLYAGGPAGGNFSWADESMDDEFSKKLWGDVSNNESSLASPIPTTQQQQQQQQPPSPLQTSLAKSTNSRFTNPASSRVGRNSFQLNNWNLNEGFSQELFNPITGRLELVNVPTNNGNMEENYGANPPVSRFHSTPPKMTSSETGQLDLTSASGHKSKSASSLLSSSMHLSDNMSSQVPQPQQQQLSASLTASPTLWATTPGSLNDTPTMHRMSRFFPSPITEQRKDFGSNNTGMELSSRSHSAGYQPTSPLNFELFNTPSSTSLQPQNLEIGVTTPSTFIMDGVPQVQTGSTPLGGATPLMLSSRGTSSYIDPLFDGFTLGRLSNPNSKSNSNSNNSNVNIDGHTSIAQQLESLSAGSMNKVSTFYQNQEVVPTPNLEMTENDNKLPAAQSEFDPDPRILKPTKLITRKIDEDEDEEIVGDLDCLISLPMPYKSAKRPQTLSSTDKITKYIKTIITKQPTQYLVYVSSLPYDTPIEQATTLINQAFSKYGDITYMNKDDNAKSSKVQPENDLYIRFKIIVKLFNDQILPFKSRRFINDSTGRDSKMLLFFDCITSSPLPSSSGSEWANANMQQQQVKRGSLSTLQINGLQSYPEGFSSTFHRRGVNNFMFVRELQSKMIINKARTGSRYSSNGNAGNSNSLSETAEFRVSVPIEELGLGVSHDFNNAAATNGGESSLPDYDESEVKKFKRSYVVSIDVRELENKPVYNNNNNNNSNNNNGMNNGNSLSKKHYGGAGKSISQSYSGSNRGSR